MEVIMAKAKLVRNDYFKAELVANWIMRLTDGDEDKQKKRREEIERLCVLNGMRSGEFQEIINGAFLQYDYKQLLEINKIINGKRKK